MKKNDLIFVAGHRGMVGSSIVRNLEKNGYNNLILKNRNELDLLDNIAVENFFKINKPKFVFLAAAKAGGIIANKTQGADFIYQNLKIQTNIINSSYVNQVKKLLFLGSSCIYPRNATQPIKESALLTSEMEQTNLPYAIAKISGKVMCDAYRDQYGFNSLTVMPSNIYGIGDNFHPDFSHVVAGLMRRFHEAKCNASSEVIVWGSGSAMRELTYVDDVAEACIFLMEKYNEGGLINAGSSFEISIANLSKLIAKTVGFKGDINFDLSKPDGTPRKIMDNTRINQLGWEANISLKEGLSRMYHWFINHYNKKGLEFRLN